jgi:hypothetical protein
VEVITRVMIAIGGTKRKGVISFVFEGTGVIDDRESRTRYEEEK